MRIMAIDPGEKRIGIALSDPSGTIASPLTVLTHISRPVDAATIAGLAQQNQASLIVIGKSFDEDGSPTQASRRADRLAEAICQQSDIQQVTWDESFSTQVAKQAMLELGISRRKRRGHHDDVAAIVILQSYLDSRAEK
jgi:putative Holliday junction resolvase